jgi:hypothetical protein
MKPFSVVSCENLTSISWLVRFSKFNGAQRRQQQQQEEEQEEQQQRLP